jgi:aspartyl-tRNA(Asn)/glutamyl-tRNA(Gln) amidotransferase subunit C
LLPDEVDRIAALARLEFSDLERERFVPTFEQILDYFRQLERVTTSHVEPTYHALDEVVSGTPLRDDVSKASLPAEVALENAPNSRDGHFRVPKVIE